MKILIIHNQYKLKGGEETVVKNEISALKARGHNVLSYIVHNSDIKTVWDRIKTAFSSIYSIKQYRLILKLLVAEKPEIVHLHNFFPMISPSAIYACRKASIPCVFTAHNYRLICPSSTLFHKGQIYTKGLEGKYFKTLRDKVYKNSYLGTGFLILMIKIHEILPTWSFLSRIIVMSEFQKQLMSPLVKANFIKLPHFTSQPENFIPSNISENKYFVYVGRLSEEKGIFELLQRWPEESNLVIVGSGPLLSKCKGVSSSNVRIIGKKSKPECLKLMSGAVATVFPSITHETFGLVNIESYSVSTPVIANNIAPSNELVIEGKTGYLFDIYNSESISKAINNVIANKSKLSENCKLHYNKKYSELCNIQRLENIFINAVNCKNREYF